MCVRVCVWNKRQNCTNSEWPLTSCNSPWLWESVHLTHFSGKLFLPDLHRHPSDTTGTFKQRSYQQEFNEKQACGALSPLPCEGNPWFDFHTRSESPRLHLFKNNLGAAERGDWSERNRSNLDVVPWPGLSQWPVPGTGGPLWLSSSSEAAFKIEPIRVKKKKEKRKKRQHHLFITCSYMVEVVISPDS